MASSFTDAWRKASSAPSTRRDTSESFQRLATIARRKLLPLSGGPGSDAGESIRKFGVGESQSEYSHGVRGLPTMSDSGERFCVRGSTPEVLYARASKIIPRGAL